MSTKAAALITIHQIVKDHTNQLFLRNFSTIKADIAAYEKNIPKSETDFSDTTETSSTEPIYTPFTPKRKDCK